jgi:predicted permease
VALALILLIGSGLMMRTFLTLRDVDPGFRDPANVLTFLLTIPAADLEIADRSGALDPERTLRMQQAIIDRLAAVAGVESAAYAAFSDGLPLDGDGRSSFFSAEVGSSLVGSASPAEVQFVSPRFFETLRTPLVAGRTFDWSDVYGARPVVLVSENLARAKWGSPGAAVGQRIRLSGSDSRLEVVGVVKDVHHNGLSQPAPETVVFHVASAGSRQGINMASVVIRSARVGTAGFLEDLRAAIWAVNGRLSPANVRTLDDLYQRSMARTSMTLMLLGITGAMALLLGVIGIYGVVGYAVSQRRREIGIRLALGARNDEVRRMFVRRALVLVAFGVAIGLAGAAGLTRLMASQLFGVSALDPVTHLAVAFVLITAAALASYVSARGASALDPVEVLKGN